LINQLDAFYSRQELTQKHQTILRQITELFEPLSIPSESFIQDYLLRITHQLSMEDEKNNEQMLCQKTLDFFKTVMNEERNNPRYPSVFFEKRVKKHHRLGFYGASGGFQKEFQLLQMQKVIQPSMQIELFDSDPAKWGKHLEKITIRPPEDIQACNPDFLFITSIHHDEIYAFLDDFRSTHQLDFEINILTDHTIQTHYIP
jgi:hypothetical protein